MKIPGKVNSNHSPICHGPKSGITLTAGRMKNRTIKAATPRITARIPKPASIKNIDKPPAPVI